MYFRQKCSWTLNTIEQYIHHLLSKTVYLKKNHKKQNHKTNHCEHHQNIVAENMSRFSVEINLRFIFIWPSM